MRPILVFSLSLGQAEQFIRTVKSTILNTGGGVKNTFVHIIGLITHKLT